MVRPINGIVAAGDFTLDVAKLLTSAGIEIDIKANIMQINIVEDIKRNSITGEILVQDAGAFVNRGPIIGQEYFQLKVRTPSLENQEEIIDFTENMLLINSVENRAEVGNDISLYALSFTSSELVKNQRTRVNKSLRGSFSEIVKEMLETVNCQKRLFLEPTRGSKRIVAPNATPFDIISLAAKNATSVHNETFTPNYLFFETLKGYNFRSLSSLYAQPVVHKYDTFIPGTQALFENRIERELQQILDFGMVSGNDSLFNHTTGVFGSKLISHNIYTKSFEEYTYNYFDNFENEKHILSYHGGGFPIFSETTIERKAKSRVSDFPSRTFLTSVSKFETDKNNTEINGTEPHDAFDPENSIQERESTLNQLERGILINIIVHGNTMVNAGDVVEIDIPLTTAFQMLDEEIGGSDRFYSGVFLIKEIKHSFDFGEKKHKSILTLVKDSLPIKLPEVTDQEEPKPNKSLNVVSDKDILYPQR